MRTVDRYRAEATKARKQANAERDPEAKAELYRQARAWLDLTLTAEVHSHLKAAVREKQRGEVVVPSSPRAASRLEKNKKKSPAHQPKPAHEANES